MKPPQKRRNFALLFVLISLFCTVSLRAQLPVNNDVWKARCTLLANSVQPTGTALAALVAATRGVAGPKFYVLAVNRDQAAEHYVSCVLYYLAAIADAAGNGGRADPKMAKNYAILAGAEVKLAQARKLTFAEHLKRGEMKVEASAGLSLNSDDTAAVLNAATTLPIVLPRASK